MNVKTIRNASLESGAPQGRVLVSFFLFFLRTCEIPSIMMRIILFLAQMSHNSQMRTKVCKQIHVINYLHHSLYIYDAGRIPLSSAVSHLCKSLRSQTRHYARPKESSGLIEFRNSATQTTRLFMKALKAVAMPEGTHSA